MGKPEDRCSGKINSFGTFGVPQSHEWRSSSLLPGISPTFASIYKYKEISTNNDIRHLVNIDGHGFEFGTLWTNLMFLNRMDSTKQSTMMHMS